MKSIKYLMMGVVLAGATTTVYAQEDNKAVVARVSEIIKAKGADTESQVKEIFKANKKNPEVLVGIGRAYLDVKDTINAAKYAQLAIDRDKSYGASYILMGDVEVAKDNGGAASSWFEQATYFDPKNPEGYRRYAQINCKTSPTAAVAKLEELCAHCPDYPVDIISAEIYDKAGNLSKAIEYFNKVDKNKMEDYQLVTFALDYFLQGEFDKSLEVAQFGVNKFPKNAALNRIAFYDLTNLKRFDEALKYADALFNKSENTKISASDYLYYGHAYLGKKDYSNAIGMFKKVLENNTDNESDRADALSNISTAYEEQGDYDNAAKNYAEYLKTLKAPTAANFAGLASIYVKKAQETKGDEQRAAYEKAAQTYKELGEKYPAAADFATLWQARINSNLDPDMKTFQAKPFYETLANTLQAKTDRDESDNARLLEAYRYLAFYYTKKNDKANYQAYWQKVYDMDPTDANAKLLKDK